MRHEDERETGRFPAVGQGKGATGRFPAVGQGKSATGRFPAVGQGKSATGRFPAVGQGKGATGRYALEDIKRGYTGSMRAIHESDASGGPIQMIERKKFGLAPLRALGNMLYALGFAGEYRMMRFWRVLRDGSVFLAQVLAWVAVSFFSWLGRFFRGLGQDITAPFRRYRRRRRQLHRVRARAMRRKRVPRGKTFFGVSIKSTFQLAANVVGILLPVVASGVLAFTVYNVSTMQYALAVSINGEVLGYVRDQNVVESAKVLLRDRLKLAHNQTLSDWQLSPRFAIARAHSLTTAPQLVNNILTSGAENPGDLVSATAVYVGGELYAGTSEGARLKAYLDERLQRYAKDALPSAQVSYVNGVTCDPGTDDVFFAETVESFDEIVRRLNENLREAVMYTTPGNESLDIIAYTNGITLNDLLLRNPQLEGSDVASVPAMGTRLVIQREIPVLQVQVAVNETVMEDVPFAVERMDREDLAKGRVNTVQQGVNGIKEVVYKRVYVDGELDHSEVVSETIATPPVNQIDHVGTFVYNQLDPGSGGGGYIWPAPFAAYSSRGIFPGHRGVDINGEPDSPIYAANTGVVVNAGYHPSWGYNVVIEHEDGLSTLYAHCSILLVAEGQHVTRGDAIALMGSTGNSSGPHLHLEFFTTGDMWDLHDPMNFIVPPEGFDMSRW